MNPLQPFVVFDQKAVDFLESLCHKQQRFLGTSHYFWLKLFAVGHAMFALVMLHENAPTNHFKLWVMMGIFMACIPCFAWWEKRSLIRLSRGVANPLRIIGIAIYARYLISYTTTPMFFVIAVLNIVHAGSMWVSVLLLTWWLTLASLYTLPACDPLPPTTGRCREWFASLFLRHVPE